MVSEMDLRRDGPSARRAARFPLRCSSAAAGRPPGARPPRPLARRGCIDIGLLSQSLSTRCTSPAEAWGKKRISSRMSRWADEPLDEPPANPNVTVFEFSNAGGGRGDRGDRGDRGERRGRR